MPHPLLKLALALSFTLSLSTPLVAAPLGNSTSTGNIGITAGDVEFGSKGGGGRVLQNDLRDTFHGAETNVLNEPDKRNRPIKFVISWPYLYKKDLSFGRTYRLQNISSQGLINYSSSNAGGQDESDTETIISVTPFGITYKVIDDLGRHHFAFFKWIK